MQSKRSDRFTLPLSTWWGGVKGVGLPLACCLFFLLSLNTAYAQTPEANKKTDKFAEAYANADEAIERNRLTNTFFAIGPTVGLPSGLNLNASLYLWRFVVRGSGMFYGSDFMGGQADFGFSLFNGARIRHSVSFVGGYMKRTPLFALDSAFPDNKTGVSQATTYLGGAYELFMDGFFLQAGVGRAMSDELKNPMLIFQAGYLFYFPQ